MPLISLVNSWILMNLALRIVADGGSQNLIFHSLPYTKLLKKRCQMLLQVQVNLFYRRKVILQHVSQSLLWISTPFPSIQSRKNPPGTTNAGSLHWGSPMLCEISSSSKRTWLDTPFSLFALQSTCVSGCDASSFRTFCSNLLTTTVLILLGPHHDYPLILKVECQR